MSALGIPKAVVVLALLIAGGDARADDPEHFVQAKQIIAGWEARNLAPMRRQSYWAGAITAAIAALGIVAAAGRRSDGSARGRAGLVPEPRGASALAGPVAIGAGLLVSVLTVVSQTVLDADFRTLRKAITRADEIIDDVHVELFSPRYRVLEPDAVYQQWWERFELRMKQLVETRKLVREQAASLLPSMGALVATARARDARPSWVLDPPRLPHQLTFVGSASSNDPERARSDSLASARESARRFLAGVLAPHIASNPESRRLVEKLAASGAVLDGYVDYAGGTYRHYTLLGIDRDELEVMLRVASSQAKVPVAPAADAALQKAGR